MNKNIGQHYHLYLTTSCWGCTLYHLFRKYEAWFSWWVWINSSYAFGWVCNCSSDLILSPTEKCVHSTTDKEYIDRSFANLIINNAWTFHFQYWFWSVNIMHMWQRHKQIRVHDRLPKGTSMTTEPTLYVHVLCKVLHTIFNPHVRSHLLLKMKQRIITVEWPK